jgi:hypothetical protein
MSGQGIKKSHFVAEGATSNARPYPGDSSAIVPGLYTGRVASGSVANGWTVNLVKPDNSVSSRTWTRVRTRPGGQTLSVGADVLLRHGGVTPENVVPLVHGAMFTRGGGDLASTAIFIGGSDVAAAEAVAARVRDTFFGPVRVGVVVDPSGANTTAAAAVVAAARHLPLETGEKPQPRALVLGGTGPVGQRVARLLAGRGAIVTVASRTMRRADEALYQAKRGGRNRAVRWTPMELTFCAVGADPNAAPRAGEATHTRSQPVQGLP